MTPREAEEQLLTMIATSRDVATALKAGMEPAWFTDPGCRRAYELQLAHHADNGSAASFQLYEAHALAVSRRYAPDDDMATLIQRVRVSSLTHLTRKAAARYQQEVDVAETPVEEAYARLVRDLTDPTVSDLLGRKGDGGTLADAWPKFLGRVARKRDRKGVTGLSWPWPSLDMASGGISPGDYVAFLGWPKAGKTDMGIEPIVHAVEELGARALIITNELSFDDMLARVACRRAGWAYRHFHEGAVTPEDWDRLVAMQETVRNDPVLAIEHITSTGVGAVAQVRAHIERHDPAVVLWDGHQLMADSAEWTDVYRLSQMTRSLALSTSVAILVTAQLSPYKKDASYRTYHRDCTLAVRGFRDGDWLNCETSDVREGRPARWSMHMDRGRPLVESPWRGAAEDGTPPQPQGSVLGKGD